jgi:hypothetical protein
MFLLRGLAALKSIFKPMRKVLCGSQSVVTLNLRSLQKGVQLNLVFALMYTGVPIFLGSDIDCPSKAITCAAGPLFGTASVEFDS